MSVSSAAALASRLGVAPRRGVSPPAWSPSRVPAAASGVLRVHRRGAGRRVRVACSRHERATRRAAGAAARTPRVTSRQPEPRHRYQIDILHESL